MKYAKFFELAKQAGIQEAELYIHKSATLSFSVFHGEVDNYSANNGFAVEPRGLFNGKFGTASCDVWNLEKAKYLIDEIGMYPKEKVTLDGEDKEYFERLIRLLDEVEDVQNVYHNVEL